MISSVDVLSASKPIIFIVEPLQDRETVCEPTDVTGETSEIEEQAVSEPTDLTG